MLWKDLAIGFLVGGILSAFVPDAFWKALFLTDASPSVRGRHRRAGRSPDRGRHLRLLNRQRAACFRALGRRGKFGGDLAFLYVDPVVVPLLDTYRRHFGLRMAAHIGGVIYVTMAIAALFMDLAFTGLGLVPRHHTEVRARLTHIGLNYTFWLNLIFGFLGAYLWWVGRRHPMHQPRRSRTPQRS